MSEQEQNDAPQGELERLADLVALLARRVAYLEGDTYVPSSKIAKALYEETQEHPTSGVTQRLYQGVMAP